MDKDTIRRRNIKEWILKVVYFPFQLVIAILISPALVMWFAYAKACDQAWEDVWITKDNPRLNQDGPSMTRKKKHWWITRFLGLDLLLERD